MQQIYKRTRTPLDGYFCHLFCSVEQMTVFFKKWACYVHSYLSLLKLNIKNQNNPENNVFIFIQCGKISQISTRICLWEWFNRVGIFILRDALRDLVYLYYLKKMKNTHGGVLFLVKLQPEACNFTKINTPSWVFFMF